MPYFFDNAGWLTSNGQPDRVTDAVPPVEGGGLRANWTGKSWVLAAYVAPAPVPTPAASTIITTLAFRNRFTTPEKVFIELACLDVPTALTPARQQSAALRVNQMDVLNATFIDLSRPDTRAGVLALQSAGIIGAGRATVILDTPVADIEKPVGR